MTVTVQEWSEHPAGIYSSFANDDRCYEVHCILGDTSEEVQGQCIRLMRQDKTLVDYDYNFDSVIDKWVGVTCRDYVDV